MRRATPVLHTAAYSRDLLDGAKQDEAVARRMGRACASRRGQAQTAAMHGATHRPVHATRESTVVTARRATVTCTEPATATGDVPNLVRAGAFRASAVRTAPSGWRRQTRRPARVLRDILACLAQQATATCGNTAAVMVSAPRKERASVYRDTVGPTVQTEAQPRRQTSVRVHATSRSTARHVTKARATFGTTAQARSKSLCFACSECLPPCKQRFRSAELSLRSDFSNIASLSCLTACMQACMHIYVCKYVCKYVCMYVCMYVCL
jgi:hypothetical protein